MNPPRPSLSPSPSARFTRRRRRRLLCGLPASASVSEACSLCAVACAPGAARCRLSLSCFDDSAFSARRGALGINRDAAARPIWHWDWEVWNALGPTSVYLQSRDRVAQRCALMCSCSRSTSRFLVCCAAALCLYRKYIGSYIILFLVFWIGDCDIAIRV